MRQRIKGLVSFICGAAWPPVYDLLKSLLHDRIIHMMNPYLAMIPPEIVLRWGPSLALAALGFWFFIRSGDKTPLAVRGLFPPNFLKFIAPAEKLPKVDLTKAAQDAYSATQDSVYATICERGADGSNNRSDEIFLAYAEAIARHAVVWGCREPSHTTKPQDLTNYRLVMGPNGIFAKELMGQSRIANLMIERKDLDAFIDRVRKFPGSGPI